LAAGEFSGLPTLPTIESIVVKMMPSLSLRILVVEGMDRKRVARGDAG